MGTTFLSESRVDDIERHEKAKEALRGRRFET